MRGGCDGMRSALVGCRRRGEAGVVAGRGEFDDLGAQSARSRARAGLERSSPSTIRRGSLASCRGA